MGFVTPHHTANVLFFHLTNAGVNAAPNVHFRFKECSAEKELNCCIQSEQCHQEKMEVYKRHLLGHRDISEVQMYKCKMCEHHTKYKGHLKRHSLTHKDISEVQMFKCEMCEYQTKYRGGSKRHLLTHKDVSEVQMYNCEMCEYQSKHKEGLEDHLLVHKNISEVQMHKAKPVDT
ncbi:hypothetical protein NQ317_016631 [Molorchus minor]|uniref:C2H2-type domain-containing protein n=1 Tax=Molorchus minor TaxID=1323400 RepID=A0ABQ9IZ40_9CUCU|nr:hypothetical protein NQ317_016631 [Molorchus minor]